jgi:hypothetical protein
MISRKHCTALVALIVALAPAKVRGQENYEIQVYPAETMPKGVTMFELHSNYTLKGRSTALGDELPTNHQLHETLEITHGFSSWSELGFYWFMAKPQGGNLQWVGTHIRPRIRVPEGWGWPVGLSISQEIGYSEAKFSGDTWTYELRPIIDKLAGRWYLSLNPVLGKSLRGPNAADAFDFTPNAQLGFDLTSRINIAAEYYGSTGTIREVVPIAQQEHMLFGALNLDFGPAWEFNVAYGSALTAAGDKSIVKMIFGRRIGK